MTIVKAAAVQISPALYSRDGIVERIVQKIHELDQALNTNLRIELGSPWWAAFISYLIGTVAMLTVAIASGGPWLSKTSTLTTPTIMSCSEMVKGDSIDWPGVG